MRSTSFGIHFARLCLLLCLLLYWAISTAAAATNLTAAATAPLADAAQPSLLEVNGQTTRLELAPAGYWLADPGSRLTIADAQRPLYAAQFSNAQADDLKNMPSALWWRYRVSNTAPQALSLQFDTRKNSGLELAFHVLDGHGGLQTQLSSPGQSLLQRPLQTPTLSFPFDIPAHATVDVLVRVRTYALGAPAIAPVLWRPDAYQAQARKIAARWFAYLGLVVGLTLFNLGLFLFTRNGGFLRYAMATLGIAALVETTGYGFAYEYFWPASPMFQRAAPTLSTMAAIYFATLFIERLIDLRRHLPRLRGYLHIGLWLALGLQAVNGLIYALQLHELAWLWSSAGALVNFAILGVIVMLFGAIVFVALRGDRSALLLLLAWAPIFITVLLTNIVGLNTRLSQLFSADVNTQLYMLASAFEVVITALVMAEQFSGERRERVLAQQALVDALRRSERELEDKVAQRTEQLQTEQGRTEALLQKNQELLHNMLPVGIAEELARTGASRPVRHESVTILFTDFSGFTQAASTMPPGRMVFELNDIFAAFDQITSDCGIEKIKTIGDAYMAAAGVVTPCEDHAQRCVEAGLRMFAYLEQRNREAAFKWGLRVGIHSGPVVAGVVGTKRYAFDIWGDTVNLASRMESSGEVGRVNISAYTYDLARRDFSCSYRGKINAKGKGEVDMYFVESRNQALAAESALQAQV